MACVLLADRTHNGGPAAIFPSRLKPAFLSSQESLGPPSSAALRPRAVQDRSARRRVIATKAAVGAADPRKDITMATDRDDTDFEPVHDASPTDYVLTELQLYGHRPFQDDPDPRPLPDAGTIAGAIVDIFDALVSTLSDTRLEPDLEELLWSTVNLFHRATDRIERELDDNERAQHRSQKEQNGSEVRSVELERLIAQGLTLIQPPHTPEFFPDPPPRRQGRAFQAQRPDPRGPADRRHRLPGLRHPGEPHRQGEEARHPGLAFRHGRRVSAAFRSSSRLAMIRARRGGGGRRNPFDLCHGDPPWLLLVLFSASSVSSFSSGF